MIQKRKQSEEGADGGSWLSTYADMITLVLTFFIAMLGMADMSQSNYDGWKDKMQQEQTPPSSQTTSVDQPASQSVTTGEVVDVQLSQPQDFSQLLKYIQDYVEQNGLSAQVEVTGTDDIVFIRFNQSVFFGGDSSWIRPESKPLLDFLSKCFCSLEDEIVLVNIYGHTASVPNPDTYPVSARMLSSERAARVGIYLEDAGLTPTKINALGQGNSFPIADNSTPEGREKNRRVDMAVVSTKAQINGVQELLDLMQGQLEPIINKNAGALETLLPLEDSIAPDGTEPSGTK